MSEEQGFLGKGRGKIYNDKIALKTDNYLLKIAGNGHLLVKLGRLCQIGFALEVRYFENIGTT